MKKLLFLLTLIALGFNVVAQNFEWAKNMGGINQDIGYSIAVDDSGNVYTTGNFQGTADFDPGVGIDTLTSVGSDDIFVSKLDASGNFVWAKRIGGTSGDRGYSIAVDGSGNIYTTGFFQGTADFDPGAGIVNLTSAGNADIFVSKLDASGNFVWAKNMGGIIADLGYSIAVDDFGNVYTTGYFSGTADFDPGAGSVYLTSAGNEDIFVSKLDASGNFVWAKKLGGSIYDYGKSIAVDVAGNVYTTGNFQGTVDFDPGAGFVYLTSTNFDIFVSKLDASGNFVWAKNMGGTLSDIGGGIAIDPSRNVYTTGYFSETADFDPGAGTVNLTSVGGEDIFVSKLDTSGNLVWAKNMGGILGDDIGISIAVDFSGNIYTTGHFSGTADFDPGAGIYTLTSAGNIDIFISKLDASGNFVWAKNMGGGIIDYGISIVVDAVGNVYTTGKFSGTADFDPGVGTVNLTSAGSGDIFVSKLGCSGVMSTDTVTACDSVIWLDGLTYTSSTNTSSFTIVNGAVNGCDSVVTLNLTINSNTGIDIKTTCDSLTWLDGITYSATTSTPTFTLTNAAGCDSVVTLNLTINANSSTDVITACDSIAWIDGNTYTASTNAPTFTLTNAAGCDSVVTLNLSVTTIDNTTSLNNDTLTANETGATYRWLNCDSSNVVIAGATAQSFTPTATGNYAVEITVGACIDTSACVNVIITNIEELTRAGIKIYPNPINDKIVIELANFSPKTQLNIVSVEGKVVYSNAAVNSNKLTIDAAAWSKGVYFVTVSNDITSNTLKLIKE